MFFKLFKGFIFTINNCLLQFPESTSVLDSLPYGGNNIFSKILIGEKDRLYRAEPRRRVELQ
jgi:hypothetical protein